MLRKRLNPTPGFRLPPPFNPLVSQHASLQVPGVSPYCALMQVAAEDTHENYVLCRGFDTRLRRFIDYDEADLTNKPGIAVAKPHDRRYVGVYQIDQVFPALLPLARLGQNPGMDDSGDLALLTDDDSKYVNWLLLDSTAVYPFSLKEDLWQSDYAEAYHFTPDGDVDTDGATFTVYDLHDQVRMMALGSDTLGEGYGALGWCTADGTVVSCQYMAQFINGTASGAVAEGDETFDVANPVVTDGGQMPVLVDEVLEGVVNRYAMEIDDGALVDVKADGDQSYYCFQAKCPA